MISNPKATSESNKGSLKATSGLKATKATSESNKGSLKATRSN
jgi:hypothetical protein